LNKKELIDILKSDNSSPDTPIKIYMECTNNDTGFFGELEKINYNKGDKELIIIGTYEEVE
jgi:hypothetical protein